MSHAGLYIHIPFCQSKCGYCSFNSIPANRTTADAYLQAIQHQAITYSTQANKQHITFTSIFFGGGTPTLASPEKLSHLLHFLLQQFNCSNNPEISIEANPNSVSKKDLGILRTAGFNRLSLGVQSFNDPILKRIQRTHTGAQAKQAMTWAREVGFTNLNCDLIYGLPTQTANHWQDDLHSITDTKPDHLSMYELSVEKGTSFHTEQRNGTLILPDDDGLADMEDISKEILASTYHQYEISNFSREGKECRHNLTYWKNGTYLGLGAGAVSYIKGTRFTHQTSPQQFVQAIQQNQSTIIHSETLDREARFRETVVIGLRLVRGVNLAKLEKQSKMNHRHVYGSLIEELIAKKHLVRDADYIHIPKSLLGIANQILHQLV